MVNITRRARTEPSARKGASIGAVDVTTSALAVEYQAADELTEAVRRQLHELVAHGASLSSLGPIEQVAEGIVRRLPVGRARLADAVGPCYTSGGLQEVLGVGRAALSKAVAERRALRLTSADKHFVYPAFQVHDDALVTGLRKVLLALEEASNDPWVWATWLHAPLGSDDAPLRRVDQLAQGDVDTVVAAARASAAAWAA